VFSAASLMGTANNTLSNKGKKLKNELSGKALKIWVVYFK